MGRTGLGPQLRGRGRRPCLDTARRPDRSGRRRRERAAALRRRSMDGLRIHAGSQEDGRRRRIPGDRPGNEQPRILLGQLRRLGQRRPCARTRHPGARALGSGGPSAERTDRNRSLVSHPRPLRRAAHPILARRPTGDRLHRRWPGAETRPSRRWHMADAGAVPQLRRQIARRHSLARGAAAAAQRANGRRACVAALWRGESQHRLRRGAQRRQVPIDRRNRRTGRVGATADGHSRRRGLSRVALVAGRGAGRFERAIRCEQRGRGRANAAGAHQLVAGIRHRIEADRLGRRRRIASGPARARLRSSRPGESDARLVAAARRISTRPARSYCATAAAGDPLAGRLLRFALPLERRHRTAAQTPPAPDHDLGRQGCQFVRHRRVHRHVSPRR